MAEFVDLNVEIYPETEPPWIHISMGFPLEDAEDIFKEIGTTEWANQMIDGVKATRAAESMGIYQTERTFKVGDHEYR